MDFARVHPKAKDSPRQSRHGYAEHPSAGLEQFLCAPSCACQGMGFRDLHVRGVCADLHCVAEEEVVKFMREEAAIQADRHAILSVVTDPHQKEKLQEVFHREELLAKERLQYFIERTQSLAARAYTHISSGWVA
jgi:hypothetical protein